MTENPGTSAELPPLRHPLDPGWARALTRDPAVADQLRRVGGEIAARRAAGEQVLPAPDDILRAFRHPGFDSVKVLILGQDPYPTPGHAMGMSFSLRPEVRPLARSLQNIFAELADDLGIPPSPHGDLSVWADQGVLLLNRVLTVRAGAAGSHRGLGWEEITEAAVRALASRGPGFPLVALLWGADARKMAPLLRDEAARAGASDSLLIIESPHPSPLSARRGFFGSRPFSRTNEFLASGGAAPINWQLPPASSS